MAKKEANHFKLTDTVSVLGEHPTMREYLRCYTLPPPPEARYGHVRFESRQLKYRVKLFGQAWLPPQAMGTVLLVHGFSEHSGNFSALIRELVAARFAVAAMDLRGHGLSEGPKGHTDTPTAYAEDLEQFLEIIFPSLVPNRPLFLWAHSLGALTGLQLLRRGKLPVRPHGAVFTSAFVGFPELTGLQKFMASLAPLLARPFPTLPIPHGLVSDDLSHDKEYLNARAKDPLINKVATPRWFMACKQAIEDVQAHATDFQTLAPTLFLLAGDERITNANEARRFAFQAYTQLRHKVIEFPGYRHELEKEPGLHERIVSETLAWFRSHI